MVYRTWGGAQVFFFAFRNMPRMPLMVCYDLKVNTGDPHDPGLCL